MWASDEEVLGLALTLAAAESAGIARWCLETASDYAKVRVQFGRPIGQFQAVKHKLADMLVAVEQCAAVAWDAAAAWSEAHAGEPGHEDRHAQAGALSARIAGAIGLEAATHCAKQCIQILGGIGFTWEHDAHLYLKRAMANLQLAAAATSVGSSTTSPRSPWPAPAATSPPIYLPRPSRCARRSVPSWPRWRPPAPRTPNGAPRWSRRG